MPSIPAEEQIQSTAVGLGFQLCGMTAAAMPETFDQLKCWVEQGRHGEMNWIPERLEAYSHPDSILPGVKSVVMLGMTYRTERVKTVQPGEAKISRYAWGDRDYHTLIRKRLKKLIGQLQQEYPEEKFRGVVDTAPLLERDFARKAGLGWMGKNTMLINKQWGSDFFISALLTTLELKVDAPHATSHCGTCTRCLEACPTQAFEGPGKLDARKCLAYLTIELRDQPIEEAFRGQFEDWIFGCDVCQDVCPWNGKGQPSEELAFQPVEGHNPIELKTVLSLRTQEQFLQQFQGTPLKRTGRQTLLRNALIVAASQPEAELDDAIEECLGDESELVRETAQWAKRNLEILRTV